MKKEGDGMEIIVKHDYKDDQGTKRSEYFRNGLVGIAHFKPSQKFVKEEIKPRLEQSRLVEVGMNEEKKIHDKMREIAKRELEKENDN